jgi:hypothetical protein
MVISQILGGLGNQMFQYAAGRSLSLSVGHPLLLDLSGFDHYSLHHGFELARVFAAPVLAASTDEVREVLGWRASKFALKLLKRMDLTVLRGKSLAIEPHFNYWTGFRELDFPCYLMGYWQSEKYFADIEAILRKDFSFKVPLTGQNIEISSRMQDCQSVSLHVRRGDYVTHAATSKVLNVCSLEYYRKAITHIADHVTSPKFFVFSDDLPWVKNNLKATFQIEYVDGNQGPQSYIDMQLMSHCKHHVIANSSFSWWGAWLNPSPKKVVIAPRQWFCNGLNDSDLVPQQWVRL